MPKRKATMEDVLPVPTEDEEQMQIFQWAMYQRGKHPELALLFHIPNGGKRGKAEAARFKAMGVKSGVPDLCLPVSRGGYHGLYIELKRRRGGQVSGDQREWIAALLNNGYCARVCRGSQEAIEVIRIYIEGGLQRWES